MLRPQSRLINKRRGESYLKRCRFCGKTAEVSLRYANMRLCRDHFIEYIEKRVLKTIEQYKMIRPNERVVAAVSGGKDSVSLLHILAKLREKLRFDLVPLHIDLGISVDDFSKRALEAFRENCKELDIDGIVISLKDEYGFTIDNVASRSVRRRLRRPPCSVCGTIKRYLFNKAGVELNADRVATGHNLTDEAIFLLQNLIDMNLDALLRYDPVLPSVPDVGLISKIKPLFQIYEFELELYAKFRDLKIVSGACPYRAGSTLSEMKKILDELENLRPGVSIVVVRNFLKKLKPALESKYGEQIKREVPLRRCSICNMATPLDICAFCKIRDVVLSEMRGNAAKDVSRAHQ